MAFWGFPISRIQGCLRRTCQIKLGTYREYDCHESVNGHEEDGVDADVRREVDEVLDSLTPDKSKRPGIQNVVRRRKGHA